MCVCLGEEGRGYAPLLRCITESTCLPQLYDLAPLSLPPGAVCKSGYPRANNTSSTSWHRPQQPSARLAVAESEGSPVAQITRAHVPGCSHTVRGTSTPDLPPSLSLSVPPPPPSPAL